MVPKNLAYMGPTCITLFYHVYKIFSSVNASQESCLGTVENNEHAWDI